MNSLEQRHQRPWTLGAVQELVALARESVPVSVISLKLKRPIGAVHAKLMELGLRAPSDL